MLENSEADEINQSVGRHVEENKEKRRNTGADRALLSIRQDGERQLRCFAAMGREVPPEESRGSRAPGGGSTSEDSFSVVSTFQFPGKHVLD